MNPETMIFRRFAHQDGLDAVMGELEKLLQDGWLPHISNSGLQVLWFNDLKLFYVVAPMSKFPAISDYLTMPPGGQVLSKDEFNNLCAHTLGGPLEGSPVPAGALTPDEIQALYTPPASEAPDDKDLGDDDKE